jgi:hypothetical protein
MTQLFEVSHEDILPLKDVQLTDLLRRLLHLEAVCFHLPASGVDVALNITVADGGEDGRSEWSGDPIHTDYVPNRLTIFQCKATELGPAACADELHLKDSAELKPQVAAALDAGGSYILFTTQALNQSQISERLEKMREAIRAAGRSYADTVDLNIYDANKIRDWTNRYVPAITAVLHWRGRPLLPGLQTWEHWSLQDKYLRFPFVPSDVSDKYIFQLRSTLAQPRQAARILGLPGLGKTRLALEVFRLSPPGESISNSLHQQVVYIDAALGVPGLAATVSEWCVQGLAGIVVVDNCDPTLHQQLQTQIRHRNSRLSLLTINADPEERITDTQIIRLRQAPDSVIKAMLQPVYSGLTAADLDQVTRYAEGFPLMAVMLSEARLNEDPQLGNLSDDVLVRRLLWGSRSEEKPALDIISACALFEHVGYAEDLKEEYCFVAEHIADSTPDEFYRHVEEFKERGIIEQRGRYLRVVPPPLAIRLAADWWRRCRPERAHKLIIEGMPGNLPEALCDRVAKLDFLPEARELVRDLCGERGPFGQEEVLKSERGSRLFRSLSEVNPEAAVEALERVFGNRSREELLDVVGAGRRNLIWTLENLCFRRRTFPIAARLLLAFAAAENEHWANNATGIFTQLFQVYLSGTEAPPNDRLPVIDDALASSQMERRFLAVQALGKVLEAMHFGRSGSAETQGSGPPLVDWRPNTWQEIFDYWSEALTCLTALAIGSDVLAAQAKDAIADSVRGLVSCGFLDALEQAITRVVEQHGPYWPRALEQVQQALRYERNAIPEEAQERLKQWIALLQPRTIPERLQLSVSVPPWGDVEKDDAGHSINLAEEKAKALAEECARDLQSWISHLPLVLQGEQRQAFAFGLRLGQCLKDVQPFITAALQGLAAIERREANPTVLGAFLQGIQDRDPQQVEQTLERVAEDPLLCFHIADLTRLITPTLSDLERILRVVRTRGLPVTALKVFSYGRSRDHLPPSDLVTFTERLLEHGGPGAWTSLEIMFMYLHSDSARWQACRAQFRQLLMHPNLHFADSLKTMDLHHWKEIGSKLLTEATDEELALELLTKILAACATEHSYVELDYAFRPILQLLLEQYRDAVWPAMSAALLSDDHRTAFNLGGLLGSRFQERRKPNLLLILPDELLVAWCERYPTQAPALLASMIPLLRHEGERWRWGPLARILIDRYGGQEDVLSEMTANLRTFSWSGSAVSYYERQVEPLEQLRSHPILEVRRWAGKQLRYVQERIRKETAFDEERSIGIFGRDN